MKRLVILNGRLVLSDGTIADGKAVVCSSGKIEKIIDVQDYVAEAQD